MTKKRAFAVSGPRLFLWIGSLYFLVFAAYGLVLPAALYERFRGVFFGLPKVASAIVGLAGAAVFVGLSLRDFLKTRAEKRRL